MDVEMTYTMRNRLAAEGGELQKQSEAKYKEAATLDGRMAQAMLDRGDTEGARVCVLMMLDMMGGTRLVDPYLKACIKESLDRCRDKRTVQWCLDGLRRLL